jgi:hypothetical protein
MKSIFRPKWQTWWMVAGPRLPQSEYILLPGIVLAPLTDETFEKHKKEGTPVPTIKASSDTFSARYPPRDVVQSRYKLQIDVDQADEAEAAQEATDIANRLLTSLTLSIPGGRYHAEMRRMRRADAVVERSAWSQSIGLTPMSDPMPFEIGDIDRTLRLYDRLENDETAENAYIHLLTAWQLQETSGSKPLQRSILQHYVLSIETIINGMMRKVKSQRADTIKQDERKFAEDFCAELPRRADKPKAIRDASTHLRVLGLQNTLPAIDMIASILSIPETTRDQAKELYKFRSSSLSHPGRAKTRDLEKWLKGGPTITDLCAADVLARQFLARYCALDQGRTSNQLSN